MLPCFLGSLQLPDGDCKVSWELPRFRMDAPSKNLWSFEEHFCCFYFQRLNAFMATLAKTKAQNLDSVAVLCLPTCPDNCNSICKRSSPSCPDKPDGGASAANALSHGARMLLVNLSLINKAERNDNNKYWTYLAYIHSKGFETKTGPSGLKTAWPKKAQV